MNTYVYSRVSALVAGLLLVAGLMVPAAEADASPPVTVRGIDLPMVLSLHDRARLLKNRLGAIAAKAGAETKVEPDALPEADPDADPIPDLSHVDTVVLDPGHGGGNSGATGVADVHEKYLTLELAYALRRRLQQRHPHLRVVLTRYWDKELSLPERTHLANRLDADLFLSLHYNAAVHNRAVGFETYFLATDQAIPGKQKKPGQPLASASPHVTGLERERKLEEHGVHGEALEVIRRDLARQRQHRYSGILAETVQKHLRARIDSVDRGVKQANFGVLRGALMPAVVVESGFLTHPEEGESVLGDTHRSHLVDALVHAVEEFDAVKATAAE